MDLYFKKCTFYDEFNNTLTSDSLNIEEKRKSSIC